MGVTVACSNVDVVGSGTACTGVEDGVAVGVGVDGLRNAVPSLAPSADADALADQLEASGTRVDVGVALGEVVVVGVGDAATRCSSAVDRACSLVCLACSSAGFAVVGTFFSSDEILALCSPSRTAASVAVVASIVLAASSTERRYSSAATITRSSSTSSSSTNCSSSPRRRSLRSNCKAERWSRGVRERWIRSIPRLTG